MATFEIHGGVPLHGSVSVGGAKNAALPMMAAAILAEGAVRLEGVPQLTDVETLAALLRQLGLRVERSDAGLTLETVDRQAIQADYERVRSMRASFCVLGPLLARRGRAEVALPGGCNIGQRPVDLHLHGLAALGARLQLKQGYVVARAERLRGATIELGGPRGPTVTGTANVLCAAVLAEGTTVIRGAAQEPEIVDLGQLLVKMGARLAGLGTSTIQVQGVRTLSGTVHRVIPDRIEAATLLLAAAITRGAACVTHLEPQHLRAVTDALTQAGAELDIQAAGITIDARRPLRPVSITAEPYPGVPTDVQAQWTALATITPGRCRIRDRVFPSRFLHVAELRRLGAQIRAGAGSVLVRGVPRLQGARISAGDLRASAALVLAGLAADGCTILEAIEHLDRGYEQLNAKLAMLGARIVRRA